MNGCIFHDYSSYYELLYRDKDYEGEANYIASVLRGAAPQARTILEFGCGSGRHARSLSARGYQVSGIEQSAFMVDIARQSAAATRTAFECVHGDIRTVDLGRRFDAVISLFHVVSYQTTNQDVLQTLASATRHLKPGGLFFFDVWHGPAVLTQRPSVRVKRIEDESLRVVRIAEPALNSSEGTVTVRYTIHAERKKDGHWNAIHEEHRMRYFFPTEIDLFARATGFLVERTEEFLTRKEPSDATWGVAYLLRKLS